MRLEEIELKADEYQKALLELMQNSEKAAEVFSTPNGVKNYLGISDDDMEEMWRQTTFYYHSQEFEKAIQLLSCQIVFEPSQPTYYIFLGSLFFQMGKISEALAAFQGACTLQPDDPSLLLYIGQCYLSLNQHDEAKNFFEKSLELAKTSNVSDASQVRANAEQALKDL